MQSHFAKLDKSGDGLLSKDELVNGLSQAGLSLTQDQIESVWRVVDEDKVDIHNETQTSCFLEWRNRVSRIYRSFYRRNARRASFLCQ